MPCSNRDCGDDASRYITHSCQKKVTLYQMPTSTDDDRPGRTPDNNDVDLRSALRSRDAHQQWQMPRPIQYSPANTHASPAYKMAAARVVLLA